MSDVPLRLIGTLSAQTGQVIGTLQALGSVSGDLSFGTAECPEYDGPYEFVPTQSQQTVYIEGEKATENIIIKPIPEYYGLISWNGSWLGVS